MVLHNLKERGSVYLMVVFAMAVIIVLMVMGIITINTNQVVSALPAERAKFLQQVQDSIASWYRSNSADPRLWNPANSLDGCASGPCEIDNNVFLKEVGIQNKYNIRFFVTDVFQTYNVDPPNPLSADFHNNIIFRRIYFAVGDTDVEPLDAVEFSKDESGLLDWSSTTPATNQETFKILPEYEGRVFYGYVDGRRIQEDNQATTYDILLSMARLQEGRFKSKWETDQFHDIGVNYFRTQFCDNPFEEELLCVESVDMASSLSPRVDETGSLETMREIGFREVYRGDDSAPLLLYSNLRRILGDGFPTHDAWGNPILISNAPASGASLSPPYSMVVGSVTPWGTWLIVNAIQPVN